MPTTLLSCPRIPAGKQTHLCAGSSLSGWREHPLLWSSQPCRLWSGCRRRCYLHPALSGRTIGRRRGSSPGLRSRNIPEAWARFPTASWGLSFGTFDSISPQHHLALNRHQLNWPPQGSSCLALPDTGQKLRSFDLRRVKDLLMSSQAGREEESQD